MEPLSELTDPRSTAVVTMEMQRGVVGDLATIPALRDAAEAMGLVPTVAQLCQTARSSGVHVVHATVSWRGDRAGTALNTPLARSLASNADQMLEGSAAVELVTELDGFPSDLRSHRHHGLTPFTGTDLDAMLRACGVTTVVAAGVSLNVGVLGLCLGAADLGYEVVVPTDAVCGVPDDYAAAVVRHTLRPLATTCTVADLVQQWRSSVPE
jgi:nicotinamidase-related amidase